MYSECKITYATDKLIAIADLAEDRRTRGEYPYLGSMYYVSGNVGKHLTQKFAMDSQSSQVLNFLDSL